MNYQKPSQFLRSNSIKVEVGDVLDPQALGMAPDPRHGPLPVVRVLEAKADGSIFLLGEITCECGEVREIHPGDWFQVRACATCTKRAQRKASKVVVTEAEKTAKKLAREAKSAADALVKAEAKVKAAEAKAAKMIEAAEAAKVEAETKVAEQTQTA